jgi:DNA-binding transcriptional LysR family regulator
VVQEGNTDLTLLSLVAAGAGLTFCVASAKARKPADVALLEVSDLKLTVRLDAVWRTDNSNPALPHFLATVRSLAPRGASKV